MLLQINVEFNNEQVDVNQIHQHKKQRRTSAPNDFNYNSDSWKVNSQVVIVT